MFSAAMLGEIAQANAQGTRRGGSGKNYLVHAREKPVENPDAGFKLEAETQNLEIANELAMKHFREAWLRCCPDTLKAGVHQWVK